MTEREQRLLASLKEMREACCAAMRIVVDLDLAHNIGLEAARVSVKHLGRYVHESSFRLNEGNVARKTLDSLDSFIAGVANKRLTYQSLIQ